MGFVIRAGAVVFGLGFLSGCEGSTPAASSPASPSAPTSELPLGNVVALSVGGYHACATLADTTVRCWGQNLYAQLGDNSDALVAGLSARPVAVGGLPAVASVAAGKAHSCALATDHTVWCWGQNLFGESGNGSFLGGLQGVNAGKLRAATPVPVAGLSGTSMAIAASAATDSSDDAYTCALMADQSVQCWGEDEIVSLSGGAISPTTIGGLSNVVALAPSWYHACALLGGGTVKCWGTAAVGGADTDESRTPVAVAGLGAVTQVVAGSRHACALTAAGAVACWGPVGALLGNGDDASSVPVPVRDLADVTMIAASGAETCALRADRTVWCWGEWPVDSSDWTSVPTPAPIDGVTDAVTISVGYQSACALLSNGTVACWGDNSDGALGMGSTTPPSSGLAASIVVAGS